MLAVLSLAVTAVAVRSSTLFFRISNSPAVLAIHHITILVFPLKDVRQTGLLSNHVSYHSKGYAYGECSYLQLKAK